ncbi:hypothetical protein EDC24_1799 [Aquisalibacillus elongatus]|uniref:Uncharacterized protein n=1 Tax=Aquisalibacillus elongatus TaxID=485577 RepID=A0A3N5C1Q4_9BACI|nr:hypothetical protein EDC24_1799 [Aquisalibacillus elongatus]
MYLFDPQLHKFMLKERHQRYQKQQREASQAKK